MHAPRRRARRRHLGDRSARLEIAADGRVSTGAWKHSEKADERATRYWNRNWQLLRDAVWKEDYDTMAAMQRNMDTGALDRVVFGRNELALQHYHDQLDEALRAAE